ncbi:unnamed protein product, partial [Polarella glacialis]
AAARKHGKTVVGLDSDQVRQAAVESAGCWELLPTCVSVGSRVHVNGSGQYSAKLMRASQLRRPDGLLALGEPGAPAGPEASPSSLLVVACPTG